MNKCHKSMEEKIDKWMHVTQSLRLIITLLLFEAAILHLLQCSRTQSLFLVCLLVCLGVSDFYTLDPHCKMC